VSFSLDVSLTRAFRINAPPEAVHAFLADVPRWAALFPRVEHVEPLNLPGDPTYRWTMEPMGPPALGLRTVYACTYAMDAEARTVRWTPVPGIGNAAFRGGTALAPDGGATAGRLDLAATLTIPAPGFVRALVEPAVRLEFGRMTDLFLRRLADALEGAGV
jgi:carbon monoxide dehydrogenase subunit G